MTRKTTLYAKKVGQSLETIDEGKSCDIHNDIRVKFLDLTDYLRRLKLEINKQNDILNEYTTLFYNNPITLKLNKYNKHIQKIQYKHELKKKGLKKKKNVSTKIYKKVKKLMKPNKNTHNKCKFINTINNYKKTKNNEFKNVLLYEYKLNSNDINDYFNYDNKKQEILLFIKKCNSEHKRVSNVVETVSLYNGWDNNANYLPVLESYKFKNLIKHNINDDINNNDLNINDYINDNNITKTYDVYKFDDDCYDDSNCDDTNIIDYDINIEYQDNIY